MLLGYESKNFPCRSVRRGGGGAAHSCFHLQSARDSEADVHLNVHNTHPHTFTPLAPLSRTHTQAGHAVEFQPIHLRK